VFLFQAIEVKNYTDDKVLEDVNLLLSDEVNKVNYCQSMQASKDPELLLKEYIDRGDLTIYLDDEKVFVVDGCFCFRLGRN
jgi:rhodanese-related sulfurtransferase